MNPFANALTEYSPQLEAFGSNEEEAFAFDAGTQGSSVFNEDTELEMAAEFLDLDNDQELEQFLGSLISKVGHAIGKVVKSPIGQAVGDVLKDAAKVALPLAGRAVGTFLGGPVGAMVGGTLASTASNALGLELEGLSPEDREFEVAKQFVRFAGATAKNALEAPPGNPANVAHQAAVDAARILAPGLVNISEKSGVPDKQRSGRWIRHHGRILLLGV